MAGLIHNPPERDIVLAEREDPHPDEEAESWEPKGWKAAIKGKYKFLNDHLGQEFDYFVDGFNAENRDIPSERCKELRNAVKTNLDPFSAEESGGMDEEVRDRLRQLGYI